MNEQCWFIHGIRTPLGFMGVLRYHSEGSSYRVKFNWEKAVGKVIGFYHSHPSGFSDPSTRDDRTMSAWVISEGQPMICGIFCDGRQKTFLYQKGIDGRIVWPGIVCREIPVKVGAHMAIGRWR
jgi:hypothetical protein